MSRNKLNKSKLHGQNKIFPLKTQLKPLAVAVHSASKQWFELVALDFSVYDCPEDNQ